MKTLKSLTKLSTTLASTIHTKPSALILKFALIVGLSTATTAIANVQPVPTDATMSAIKIATITQMYAQDARNQGQEYPVTLQQYGNSEFQAAMQLEQDYFDKEEASCHIGYDVLWDSQDPDYQQDKQFSMTDKGLVEVSLAQGSKVYYQLSCDSTNNDAACQVADVILDEDGSSLVDYLIGACQ